ncbi:MAG: hypothetical protein K5780_04635 [Alphaproteobacteria bacterium]|nr:hypothetical protein [Alphaproteobacteria bacterium]
MSEGTKERGLLGDIAMFTFIIVLILAVIYFTGNWPWFLKWVANLEVKIRSFLDVFTTNMKSVVDVAQNVS